MEAEYNAYLIAHTPPAALGDLLVTRTTTGDVTLAINSGLQLKVAGIMDQVESSDHAPLAPPSC